MMEDTEQEKTFSEMLNEFLCGGEDPPRADGVDIVPNDSEINLPGPFKTRKTMTRFEFVRTITLLANYIYSLHDLSDIVDEIEVPSLIFQCELAYKLLRDGKYDAIIDRGIEKVAFSKLEINPQWNALLEEYFTFQNKVAEEEIYSRLEK